MKKSRIAVVGGGPGGLFTSYLLEEFCGDLCEVTLFEAGPRLGGKVVTERFHTAPVLYEAGVAELYDYSRTGPDPLKATRPEAGAVDRPDGWPERRHGRRDSQHRPRHSSAPWRGRAAGDPILPATLPRVVLPGRVLRGPPARRQPASLGEQDLRRYPRRNS